MLVLEDYIYEKGKKTFDDSGMLREVIPYGDWKRILELHAAEGIGVFIVSHEKFPEAFYRGLKKGSLIVRYGVGYDSIPLELCRSLGLLVANTPGTLEQSVAEHAMTLVTALTRRLCFLDAEMKAGRWPAYVAEELSGRTLAVVGFGSIGRAVARIAKLGYGMRVVAFDVNAAVRDAFPGLFDEFTTDFAEAVRDADYVSINVNLSPSTAGFIDAERLRAVKKGAILVNTSRGGVINEEAVYKALEDGTLAAAGLDVFVEEPFPAGGAWDFRRLPNVLLTPPPRLEHLRGEPPHGGVGP